MTARLLVNLSALAANYRQLRTAVQQSAPDNQCGAVVKADAYGCGLAAVARALHAEGARQFFVATSAEALSLRATLPDAAIYVFEGPLRHSAARLAEAGVVPVVNHKEQLEHWRAHAALPIAVHVDTGMARLGFAPDDVRTEAFSEFQLDLLLTHFASADDPADEMNIAQLQRFAAVRARFPDVPVSVGNSAASLAAELPTQGLARPGIALYGGQPFVNLPNPMQVVASLQAQVLQVRDLAQGQTAGYGATWRAPRPSRIAVVGMGYADGLRRALSNRGQAVVAGVRVPIVGQVSMDLAHLDVTGVAGVRAGDWAEFFGEQIPIAHMTQLLDTIDYEVLTGVGPRVRREYVSR